MSSSKVDGTVINESKLDSTVHNNEVYLPGFELVRKDRKMNGRNGGGICIYLRTNLNFRMRDDLKNDELQSVSRGVHQFWSGLRIDPQALHLIFLVSSKKLLPKLAPKIRSYIYLVMSTEICCLKQMLTFLPFWQIFLIYMVLAS